jgi:hypothetical protein
MPIEHHDIETIEATDHTPAHGYPEGANPGECVAIDVDRFITGGERRMLMTPQDLREIQSEFERASRARGAGRVITLDLSWSCRGTTVLSVANADLWCAVLLRVGARDVAVFVPTAPP